MKRKAIEELPTIGQLREWFSLNPVTGALTWLPRMEGHVGDRRWNPRYAGTAPGTPSAGGRYKSVKIGKYRMLTHRIVWAMTHGRWPALDLDHIDGNTTNNAPSNLREATRSQNNMNAKPRRRHHGGPKGATFTKGKWQVRIQRDGVGLYLGRYSTEAEAAAVYAAAAAEHFGEFARVG